MYSVSQRNVDRVYTLVSFIELTLASPTLSQLKSANIRFIVNVTIVTKKNVHVLNAD